MLEHRRFLSAIVRVRISMMYYCLYIEHSTLMKTDLVSEFSPRVESLFTRGIFIRFVSEKKIFYFLKSFNVSSQFFSCDYFRGFLRARIVHSFSVCIDFIYVYGLNFMIHLNFPFRKPPLQHCKTTFRLTK